FGAIALAGLGGVMRIRSSRPSALAGVAEQTRVPPAAGVSVARGAGLPDHEGGRTSAAGRTVVSAPAPADAAGRAAEAHRGTRSERRELVSSKAADSVLQDGELVAALDGQRRPVFSPAFASNGSAMFFHTGRSG